MDKNTFLAEYKLSEDDLLEAQITWDELLKIEEEYSDDDLDYEEEYVYDESESDFDGDEE